MVQGKAGIVFLTQITSKSGEGSAAQRFQRHRGGA